ncbi:MAG: PAS domain S-box protein [Proteobacteria bacterium]|nr:PAS domain S-box protein [Pseudomonadota bacterium]
MAGVAFRGHPGESQAKVVEFLDRWAAPIEISLLPVIFLAVLFIFYKNTKQREVMSQIYKASLSLRRLLAEDGPVEEEIELQNKVEGSFSGKILQDLKLSEFSFRVLQIHKEKLKEEMAFQEHIMNEMSGLVVLLSPKGIIKYVNKAILETTGYKKDELLGLNWWKIFYPAGRDDPEIIELNRISDGGRRCIRDHVMTLRTKDGGERKVSWTTGNIFGDDGQPSALIGVGTDITMERSRAANESEQEKMKALASMAGGLAHEISNALQPVLGMSEILEIRLKGKDEELEECSRTIKRNAMHARDIVAGVLAFSRRDQKKKDIYKAADLLDEVMEFADEFLPLDVSVRCFGFGPGDASGANDDVYINVNRTEMVQVIANMFTNAAHAMKQNGVIEVMLGQASVDEVISVSTGIKPGRYAVVSIKDQGIGMNDEVKKSLFTPFFTTKPLGEGTGLGLAAVYGIVRDWGGSIKVDSKECDGTTFHIYIPLVEPEKEQIEKPAGETMETESDADGAHTYH